MVFGTIVLLLALVLALGIFYFRALHGSGLSLSWKEVVLSSVATRLCISALFVYLAYGLEYAQKTPLGGNAAPVLYCLACLALLQAYSIEFFIRRDFDGFFGALLAFLGLAFTVCVGWSMVIVVVACARHVVASIGELPATYMFALVLGCVLFSALPRALVFLARNRAVHP